MPYEPAERVVVHVAVFVVPVPTGATLAQPAIAVVPERKLTPPLVTPPETVAVNVTLVPATPGLRELATVVVVGHSTDWVHVPLFEGEWVPSPL